MNNLNIKLDDVLKFATIVLRSDMVQDFNEIEIRT